MESTLADAPETLDDPALARLGTVARLMDSAVRIPGTRRRFGLDAVLAAVPGGELLSGLVSLYVVVEAALLGVSSLTVVRMLGNIAVDSLLGLVPVVGPLLTGVWKANERNLRLLVRALWAESERRERAGRDAVSIDID